MRKLEFDDTLLCGVWIGFPAGVLADRTILARHHDAATIFTALAFLAGVVIWQWRKS